jgi:hypothetical protein
MDDLRVNRVSGVGPAPVGDGTHRQRRERGRQDRSRDERRPSPDELAFLLRRSKVARETLVNTRVELMNEDGGLRIRIVDATTGEVIGEMSGEELARLARDAHVTTGVLGEWRH